MKEKTPTRELLRCTVQYYSPQHAQIGQFSTIVSMRGRFLFQRSAVPRTRAPSWGDISCTRTRLSTHRRRRGPGTPEPHTPPVWRAPEGQEGLAAAPVGGGGVWPGTPEPQAPPVWRAPEGTGGLRGGAWLRCPWAAAGSGRAYQNHRHRRCGGRRRDRRARAGFEIDHSERSSRVAISRAAGPSGARNTSGATDTDTNTNTTKRAGTSRFRPALYAQW